MSSNTDKRLNGGFTLLELLIVMAIMVLLSTIMVTSYFGAQRAASYTASATDVRNALTLARQRACMNGKKTYFAFTNETDFIVVQPVGRLSCKNAKVYYDGYTDMADNVNAGSRTMLYNLDTFDHRLASVAIDQLDADKKNLKGETILYKGQTVARLNFYDKDDTIDEKGKTTGKASEIDPGWKEGDRYGIAITKMQRLPKGFECSFAGGDSYGDSHYVVFNPDGSVEKKATISLIETIKKDSAANRVVVSIEKSGKISVN